MERKKERRRVLGYLRLGKKLGESPSPRSDSIVTPCGCLRQEDFQTGEAVPVAPSAQLSAMPWADLGARLCRGLF